MRLKKGGKVHVAKDFINTTGNALASRKIPAVRCVSALGTDVR